MELKEILITRTMLKKITSKGMLLLTLPIFLFNCTFGIRVNWDVQLKDSHWVNESTYRAKGIGSADKAYFEKYERRESSRKKALAHAQNDARNAFFKVVGEKHNLNQHKMVHEMISNEIKSIIEDATVTRIKFSKIDECQLSLEIQEDGLKIRLKALAKSLIKEK